MSGASGLILLRTHFMDARIAELARLYAASGDYDVMIAADETAGALDAHGLPKLAMTLDSCVRLGLDVAHQQPFWRCGDYVFYHARALRPGYKHYWSIEYDIALNFSDPLEFFRVFDRQAKEEYLTTFLEIAPREWRWRPPAARRFPVVYASGFALVRLCGPAIDSLLERRRFEAARLAASEAPSGKRWLNDEAFVSSACFELGLSMADFNAYGDVYTPQTLMREGVWHPAQLPPPDGKVYHAVRAGASYMAAAKSYYQFNLKDFLTFADAGLPEFAAAATLALAKLLARLPDDPQAVFGPSGPLAGAQVHFDDPRVVDALLRALAKRRLRLCLEAIQFGRLDRTMARPEAFDNLALGRPAWQSSTSPRSRKRSLRREAEGGNDGDRESRFGCLTAQQEHPWWAVDLGGEHAIAQVRLFNRPLAEQRLRHFVIETSPDFLHWTTVFAHDGADAGLLRARPIEIAFTPAIMARYLRVRLPRRGVLHLNEVEAMRG
jgi:hypothetical protein